MNQPKKNKAAVALGRLGGKAKKTMTPKAISQRSAIAMKGVIARQQKKQAIQDELKALRGISADLAARLRDCVDFMPTCMCDAAHKTLAEYDRLQVKFPCAPSP